MKFGPIMEFQCPGQLESWAHGVATVQKLLRADFPEHELFAPPAPELEKALKSPRRPIQIDNCVTRGKFERAGKEDPGQLSIAGAFTGTFKGNYDLTVFLLASAAWDQSERLFAAIGDAMRAYSGQLTSSETRRFLSGLTSMFTSPPQGLPALQYQPKLAHRAQPATFGWANYWSKEAEEFIGYPQPADPNVLHAYRTPTGACIYKVGLAPLDTQKEEHIATLRNAWSTYPAVGVRRGAQPGAGADGPAFGGPSRRTLRMRRRGSA